MFDTFRLRRILAIACRLPTGPTDASAGPPVQTMLSLSRMSNEVYAVTVPEVYKSSPGPASSVNSKEPSPFVRY